MEPNNEFLEGDNLGVFLDNRPVKDVLPELRASTKKRLNEISFSGADNRGPRVSYSFFSEDELVNGINYLLDLACDEIHQD